MSSTENEQVPDEPVTVAEVHNETDISEASDESLNSTPASSDAHSMPSTPTAAGNSVRKVTFDASASTATPENRQDKQKIQYTPAVQKVHKVRQQFHMQSPSDAALSPCTQKLFGPSRIKAPSTSQPLSVLRSKQQADVAKFNNGEPLDE